MKPAVSVLIAQFGKSDLTVRALESVRRSTYEGSLELLVWDNGSPDGPSDVAELRDVTLVEHGSNIGFGPANNKLVEKATGDLVLFLNNDVILSPSCLSRMVEQLTSDPDIAVVIPQVRSFDGDILEVGGYVGNSGEGWQLLRGERAPRAILEFPLAAHYGSAACMLLRREAFLAAGGFDDLFSPAYYEDTDLCLRLTKMGGRVIVEPRAVAYHMEGGTAGTDLLNGAKAQQLHNRARFVTRWTAELTKRPPAGRDAAMRYALTGGDRPLVLWLMPDFLKPDQSGGHARVRHEIEALVASGVALVVWSEHVGDHGRYGRFLTDLGVTWCGYQEPSRSFLADRAGSSFSSLQELLQLDIWDAVVAWSADVAHRFGPIVREAIPKTPLIVDSTVLLYLQCERGLSAGATMVQDLITEKEWELPVYGGADGLIASSASDASAIRAELPHLDIFTFDVGAYEPVQPPGNQKDGSLVFLGNFVHPPNIDAIVYWVQEISPRIEELCGRVIPLRVIGASAELIPEVIDGGAALDVAGWVEDLGPEMSKARASIVPLRYGAGTKDKISVAMRYGVPTITTSVGAESMPSQLLRALLVSDKPVDLANYVVALMSDDTEWNRIAKETRAAARFAWDDQSLVARRFVTWFSQFASKSWKHRF